MEYTVKVSKKIIELEISVKLIQFLKMKNIIDDGMYNDCINKFIRKLESEKSKIDDNYINDIKNYKLLT